MASYYMTGYTTPEGVNSREKVKEYQNMLGVASDGIWGPKTQAAYEKYTGASAADPYMDNMDAFSKYYDYIIGKISVPGISVNVPSRAELEADYSASLRPGVELAINNRRKSGESAKAEMDADAASRGMEASTYVSSMKEREGDDVEDDVSMMEAQYTATLAERIADALQYYASLEMQAASTNASMAAAASNTAVGLASQWYQSYLNTLGESAAGTTYRGRGGSGAGTGDGTQGGLSAQQYREYVKKLSAEERYNLFYGNEAYWTACRLEVQEALGMSDYTTLKNQYSMNDAKGGARTWLMAAK